jgi:hypothetical protein
VTEHGLLIGLRSVEGGGYGTAAEDDDTMGQGKHFGKLGRDQ